MLTSTSNPSPSDEEEEEEDEDVSDMTVMVGDTPLVIIDILLLLLNGSSLPVLLVLLLFLPSTVDDLVGYCKLLLSFADVVHGKSKSCDMNDDIRLVRLCRNDDCRLRRENPPIVLCMN